MTSLILHLHGPLQAWGIEAHANTRLTGYVPTKSAIIGLLASGLGRPRGADISDLAATNLLIRVDRPGTQMRDFHTVGGGYPDEMRILTAEGKDRSKATATLVSDRYYLADAAFTVAISGGGALITSLERALRHPRWAPALGRRACPPTEPFILGLTDIEPFAHLRDRLPIVRDHQRLSTAVSFVADDPAGELGAIHDHPDGALNHFGSYRTRPVRRWTEGLSEERFTRDPWDLVGPRLASDV